MDNNTLAAQRSEFETKLLRYLLPKVKSGEMKFEDFQDISSDTLNFMEEVEVEGQFELILFLLSEKWPVLQPLFKEKKIEMLAAQDNGIKDEKINAVRDKLLKFTAFN